MHLRQPQLRQRDLVDVAEAVADRRAPRHDLVVRDGPLARLRRITALAREDQRAAVRREPRRILARGRVDLLQRARRGPCVAPPLRHEEVRVRRIGGAAERAQDQERLVGRDQDFDRREVLPVDGGAQVLGLLVAAVDEPRAVDVDSPERAFARGREVERPVGGLGGEVLVDAAVHRRARVARVSPSPSGRRAVHGPDVEVVRRLARSRAVRHEIEAVAVGRQHRVGVAVVAGEGRDLGLGPAAVRAVRNADDVEVGPRHRDVEEDGVAVGGDRAAELVERSRDDVLPHHPGRLFGRRRDGQRGEEREGGENQCPPMWQVET